VRRERRAPAHSHAHSAFSPVDTTILGFLGRPRHPLTRATNTRVPPSSYAQKSAPTADWGLLIPREPSFTHAVRAHTLAAPHPADPPPGDRAGKAPPAGPPGCGPAPAAWRARTPSSSCPAASAPAAPPGAAPAAGRSVGKMSGCCPRRTEQRRHVQERHEEKLGGNRLWQWQRE
jgi:hypothetical protein